MKYVTLLRHGQAEVATTERHDEQRMLTEIGEHNIRSVALKLKRKSVNYDILVASSAVRAKQTADIVAHMLSIHQNDVVYDKRLYNEATIDTAIHIFSEIHDSVEGILVIAHNPLLEDLSTFLCPQFTDKIRPGELITLRLPINHWREIKPGTAFIEFRIKPE